MTAIEFQNISKQYRLGLVSTRTLSHDLNRWWKMSILGKEDPYLKIGEVNDRASKGDSDYVWALRDINFKVEQGDVLGIIGKNGAGKSTLLKILSKVTAPTTGSIKARGRIASLLEVGTGFHPEMTGRENIFMNGAIMGMTKAEISRKLDEIVDFAGVERYIDTPVKRYSSGMTVRLGFAIAAHLEPEILVVDEVLAVGDAEFQKKAIGKMQDVSKGEGRTVLFVSHNMASIKMLCNTGVVLKDGYTEYIGDVNSAVDIYLKENEFKRTKLIDTIKYATSILTVEEIYVNNQPYNAIFLESGDTEVEINISGILSSASRVSFEGQLYDSNNILLASILPDHLTGKYKMFESGRFKIKEKIILPKNITKGEFYLNYQLTDPYVAYLAMSKASIKITTKGIVGETGLSFEYNRGFIVM